MRQLQMAQGHDLPDICELVNSAYRGESSRQGWTTEADFLDGQRTDIATLALELKKGNILCLRDELTQQLLGCVFLGKPEPGGSVYLGMLTVRPDQQAGGLGRELLRGAEEFARAHGGSKVLLGVLQVRASLMAWYERRGYRRTGEIKHFPYGDKRFGIPLRSDLHFVFFDKAL